MRADELIVLSVAEYNELKAKAERASGELFNAEEMQAIREQYVERIEAAEGRRDEIEWKLRMELARIREAEQGSRRAADELRRVELMILSLLQEDEDDTEVRPTVPSVPTLQPVVPRPQPVAARPQVVAPKVPVKVTAPSAPPKIAAVPPPLPPSPAQAPRSGSHAETFARAMANRKRVTA